MSALASILHVGDTVTLRNGVSTRCTGVLFECIAKRAVEVADFTGVVRVEPGQPLRLASFIDRDRWTLCELSNASGPQTLLIKAEDLAGGH